VVIAGIITIIIATNNADSLVKEDYFKEGLAINKAIGRQNVAKELGLSFRLTVNSDNSLSLTSSTDYQSPVIYLAIQHPVDENKDQILVFNRQDRSTYTTAEPINLQSVNYRLNLAPADQTWEILTRWNPGQIDKVVISAND
jgi:hypothetical protein